MASFDNKFAKDKRAVVREEENYGIISYASKTNRNTGKESMFAVANLLRRHGITTFNGSQVEAGEDWEVEFYAALEDARLAILMMSTVYFDSQACTAEAMAAIKNKKLQVIPLQFGVPNMKGNFLGDSKEQKKNAAYLRHGLGNMYPPPDQGSFDDDWDKHARYLIDLIKKKLPPDYVFAAPPAPVTAAAADSELDNQAADLKRKEEEEEALSKRVAEGVRIAAAAEEEARVDTAAAEEEARVNTAAAEEEARVKEVNKQDVNGKAALWLASFNGKEDEVKALLLEGAKIDLADKIGRTPLMIAASKGRDEIVQLLVDAGADLHLKDNRGQTALYYARLNNKAGCVVILEKAMGVK